MCFWHGTGTAAIPARLAELTEASHYRLATSRWAGGHEAGAGAFASGG
ncbi:hypothetical protein SAMN04489834_1332 [Microterricola viridarii]|uniref:Uncharacterized protein n=1 Tax=Microterricola viridarii TaxID=412690 RepID=A0A1H1RKY4_9MICO|nr:hypothetical protein SAMN04489834_1332 [Microterricola viridarii]